jgi:hypothetical protein
VNNNRLQYLPWEIGGLPKLEEFAFQANELDTPCPEVTVSTLNPQHSTLNT